MTIMAAIVLFRCCMSSTWIWIVFSSLNSVYSPFFQPATSSFTSNHRGQFSSPLSSSGSSHDHPIVVSAFSTKGKRSKMEDSYLVSSDGRFAGVFDGHGGSQVSSYIKSNVYANFLIALPETRPWKDADIGRAFRRAISKLDDEVTSINKWSHTGSTLAALYINTPGGGGRGDRGDRGYAAEQYAAVGVDPHGLDTSARSPNKALAGTVTATTPTSTPTSTPTPTPVRLVLTTANVGDSRIVLGRGDRAVDLTVDHKPSQVHEKSRIRRLGGVVRWHGLVSRGRGRPVRGSGVYRVNGNLSLSRAIGDAAERPYVSGEPDIKQYSLLFTRTQAAVSDPATRSDSRSSHHPGSGTTTTTTTATGSGSGRPSGAPAQGTHPHHPIDTAARMGRGRHPNTKGEDPFVILATDGLWDAFTSQEAVDYVRGTLHGVEALLGGRGGGGWLGGGDDFELQAPFESRSSWHQRPRPRSQAQSLSPAQVKQRLLDMDLHPRASDLTLEAVRGRVAKGLVKEAIRRGSRDNITVVVQWIR